MLLYVTYTVESAEERQLARIYRAALGEPGEFLPDRNAVGISGIIDRVRMKVSITLQPEKCGICYVELVPASISILEYDWYGLVRSPTASIWRDLVVF